MCELISANEPGPRTDTLNDYKYLIKEYFLKSDSSERIEPEEPKPNKLRSNRKDNSASTSSSSEEDVSPEKKSNRGVAELMELEEEDEIENTAIADLVNGGDPDHLAFALADVKRKFKLQEKIASKFNDRRVRRDLKTSDLADFVTRKAKELKETTNVMDRIGIAAQIGERTRNSRQCRALFNPCSMDNSKIKGLVDSLKNIVSSDRKKEKVNELDVAKLIKDAGLYNTQGLTDVKVVLNIGGGGPVNGIMDHVQSTTEWPQPSPTTIPTTTQSPPKPPPKSLSQTIKMNKTNNEKNS
ncbi:uncharacterized protein LOC110843108 [Folsomia candida]|uniref:uncharacterized protein LOC110843108 n=1 Tax=Folsomia candida TaxID=158441 RepID=UPI001604D79A|nr:uncharacterized protein LOC110843108 [Folsomia candida]